MDEFDEYIRQGENEELRNRRLLVDSNENCAESPKGKICTLNCTLEEKAVLDCIKQNPKATQKEIAKSIGKSERTVKNITSQLKLKGIISRQNGKRNGFWEIMTN